MHSIQPRAGSHSEDVRIDAISPGADIPCYFCAIRRCLSIPGMRGSHRPPIALGVSSPSTPTHVGQTTVHRQPGSFFPLNPHARGADLGGVRCCCFLLISTPACAGATPARSRVHCPTPFNPHAHVGPTKPSTTARSRSSLNPHARGADCIATESGVNHGPQPPRTWGRRRSRSRARRSITSTPTHVGQTALRSTTVTPMPLNPHARGADRITFNHCYAHAPQPPRTWGRQPIRHRQSSLHPSTPTHVGQTYRAAFNSPTWSLNPHARGADHPWDVLRTPPGPQPPRTWGRLTWNNFTETKNPSTPTHVGQTDAYGAHRSWRVLNPHARGADSML